MSGEWYEKKICKALSVPKSTVAAVTDFVQSFSHSSTLYLGYICYLETKDKNGQSVIELSNQ